MPACPKLRRPSYLMAFDMARKGSVIDLVVEARWVQIENRLKMGEDPRLADLADALRNAQPEVPGLVRHYLAELVETFGELQENRQKQQVVEEKKPAEEKKKPKGFDQRLRAAKVVEAHLLMLEKMHEIEGRGDIPKVDDAIAEVAREGKIREEVLKHRIYPKAKASA